jgi:hypothetical protein
MTAWSMQVFFKRIHYGPKFTNFGNKLNLSNINYAINTIYRLFKVSNDACWWPTLAKPSGRPRDDHPPRFIEH